MADNPGVLDLSGADTSDGFAPIPSGTYDMTVYEAKWAETKGEGKLPKSPMLKVQFKIADDQEDSDGNKIANNRRFFTQYVLPPKKVDGKAYENYDKMNGIFARFLESTGVATLEEITSGNFDLDLAELKGRPVRVVIGLKPKYGVDQDDETIPDNEKVENEVKGVKPPLQQEAGLI